MSDKGKPESYDAEALRRKYEAERAKRTGNGGEAQYVEATGAFADFVDDPYLSERLVREPVTEEVDVAIIGGGFGGLLTAVELRRQGISSFRIIDQAGDFGGTWYWNRYPGVRCDIESYVYMPLLEEVGTIPSERYASGAEIFEHCRAIGRHFGLYDQALLQTKVTQLAWREDRLRWEISTDRGDKVLARFVTASQGPLAKVKLPGIPGIRRFKGKMFHSARWDFDYTGGDARGGLTGLKGKRVALIGTGATAVQIAPKVAAHADELLIFQRTPSALAVRNNSSTDASWFRSQPKGWQRARMENFLANITPGEHPDADVVADGWTDFFGRVRARLGAAAASGKPFNPQDIMQLVDFEKMEELRARINQVVSDPDLAERVKPWYNYLCKRPLFSDHFLECLNLPNVNLVDTDGRGVTEIDETSVHANGQAFEVDCIIFATGFDVNAASHKVGGYEVIGRAGLTMEEKWAAGIRTVHGTQMNGFPNFHIVGGVLQGTTAFNFTHTLQIQAEHAVAIISECLKRGIHSFEVTRAAEDRWLKHMETPHAINIDKYFGECTPGFLNNEGNVEGKPTFLGGTYGAGPLKYQKLVNAWRSSQMLEDADINIAEPATQSS